MTEPTEISPVTPDTPTGSPARKKGAARWLAPVLSGVAAIAVGLFGGILIGQNTAGTAQASSVGSQFGGAQGSGSGTAPSGAPGLGAGGVTGGGFTAGTVVSVSGDTVVIKTAAGKEVTVKATDSTTVTENQSASLTDLKAGDTVTATGTTDSNGDVSATSIAQGELRGAPAAN